MDLEKEKGITIKAKNTSVHWRDYTVNIVDTPGHADFGGEVERVMKMVDGVLLVVDAFDGPQAQTRFVLRKALQQGLRPIVVINKIDRPFADPAGVHDKVLELFLDLDATEEQFNAPFLYGSARDGYFMHSPDEKPVDVAPLLQTILDHIPAPKADPAVTVLDAGLQYRLGRLRRPGRHRQGARRLHQKRRPHLASPPAMAPKSARRSPSSSNTPASTPPTPTPAPPAISSASPGSRTSTSARPSPPTAKWKPCPSWTSTRRPSQMQFSINDGPFSGKDGKHVTSRAIRDRLFRETKTNVSIAVEDTDQAGVFNVSARGAMQIAILVETMRREDFEVCVSRPMVITRKSDDGKTLEPFETLYVEVPEEHVPGILKAITARRGVLEHMDHEKSGRAFIQAVAPTRGLIGFEFELVNLTSGHGIMSHLFKEYGEYAGEIATRNTGTLVSMETGVATAYSLLPLEDRGILFIAPGDEVYAGMLVGENPRTDNLPVNPVKEKHLDNMRSAGKDKNTKLSPPMRFSLERAIEYIAPDELVEATPHYIRLRKRVLDPHERRRMEKAAKG